MISFVVCSIDPQKFQKLTQNFQQRAGGDHEIVAIHDARSLCEGYNRGAARAKGETIVFCHDDIEILSPDFPAKLDRAMTHYDIVGVAGANRVIGGLWSLAGPPFIFGQITHLDRATGAYEVQVFANGRRLFGSMHALDGLFMAVRREVIQKHRFDEQTFDGWHLYDMDFTFGAHLAGFRLGVSCEIQLLHDSRGSPDQVWMKYAQLFNRKYLQHLYPMAQRNFATLGVRVATREEALEVMTPRFWDEPEVS
jgi:GT2 family glycosyltransferase